MRVEKGPGGVDWKGAGRGLWVLKVSGKRERKEEWERRYSGNDWGQCSGNAGGFEVVALRRDEGERRGT